LGALRTAKEKQANNDLSTHWQDINYHLGFTYLRSGNPAGAREAFQQVLNFGKFPTSQDKYVLIAKSELAKLK
jgi:hypothetical protein